MNLFGFVARCNRSNVDIWVRKGQESFFFFFLLRCQGGKMKSKCTATLHVRRWQTGRRKYQLGCVISSDDSVPVHTELKCSKPFKQSPFFHFLNASFQDLTKSVRNGGRRSADFVIILVLLPLLDLFTEPETAGVTAARDWAEISSFIKASDQQLAVDAILSDHHLRYLQLPPLMIIHKTKVVRQMRSYEPDRAAPSITALRRPPGGKDTSHLIDSGQTRSPLPALHSGDQRRSEAERVEAGPDPSAPQSYMSGDSIKGFHLYAWIIFFSPYSAAKEQSRAWVEGASDTSAARGAFLFHSGTRRQFTNIAPA